MKACIYLRKSRADREDPDVPIEVVLNTHESILLAFAKKADIEITEIKKEVVSGDSLSRRPEMLKLLEEVEDGLYDAVLVKDFDRLGRGNMMEQGIIINTFKSSGTKIVTPEKTYDLENEFDEEYIDISAFFARKELKMITKRLKSGRMKSIQDGSYISPYAPYGYNKSNKTLVINDNEKLVVELIFDLYVNKGLGDAKIAKYLTGKGIVSKNGNAIWDKTTIRKMIQNPVYTGKVTWDKREYKYLDSGRRTSRFLDKSEWKVYDGKHEAIISEELFEKAQIISKDRYIPHVHAAKTMRNPIAYIVKCGSCGAAMTLRTSPGKDDTLRCYKHCGGVKSSYIYLIEERLIDLIFDRFSDADIKFNYVEEEKDTDTEYSVLQQALINSETEKSKLIVQKKNIHGLLEQGVYDVNTFLERSNALTESLRLTNERVALINEQLKKCMDDIKKTENALPGIKNAQQFIQIVYWDLDPQNKNNFLRDIIGNVVYSKSHGAGKDEFTLDVNLKVPYDLYKKLY